MKRRTIAFPCFLLIVCAAMVLAGCASRNHSEKLEQFGELVYHHNPPTEPLPDTLDTLQFEENHAAFVAYALAAQMRSTLYQVPCYCPCNKHEGHKSLLDCFTSKHGVRCRLCQQEVIFSFLQQREGKSAAQIRRSMAKGIARVDLQGNVEQFYSQLRVGTK
jgi:hypothetical protein